jgi:hypothetical protein
MWYAPWRLRGSIMIESITRAAGELKVVHVVVVGF